MTDTAATIGWGAEFWLGNTATPSVPVILAEIYSLAPPDEKADTQEATHYKSPNKHREFIAGLIDGGEIQVEGNYIAGSPTDLLLTGAKRKRRAAKVHVPNGEDVANLGWDFTFEVILTGYTKAIPVDNRQTFTATFKVTGDITEAATPAS